MTVLLVTASVHDVGHDGLGNTVKGVFHPSRLEHQSINMALPFLNKTGFDNEALLKALIVSTDVTPLNDPAAPARQMKAAYRYHFHSEQKKSTSLNLSDDLKILENDQKATLLA